MTTLLDFIKITRIKGVNAYCLVSGDGRRMAGTARFTEAFCKALAQITRQSTQTVPDSHLAPPSRFTVRGPEESLIVIPVGGYTLGITTDTETPEEQLIEDIMAFLHRIRHQHTVSQKS